MITDSAVLKMIERYLKFLESANNLYNDTDKKAEIQSTIDSIRTGNNWLL